MKDDDELCLCFHVTQRKVIQYIRVQQPRRTSELSQCYGAGTGCGWCRPFLKRLFEQETAAGAAGQDTESSPSPEEYARQRAAYRQAQNESLP
tara:strand:- start:379 stop:657 length:279 start_codon:yes stop_codon:yes gene_type:complete